MRRFTGACRFLRARGLVTCTINDMTTTASHITIIREDLHAALSALIPAISTDPTRESLQRLRVEYDAESHVLDLVATDGWRLHRVTYAPHMPPLEASFSYEVSATLVASVAKATAKRRGSPVEAQISAQGVRYGDIVCGATGRRYPFPSWRQVLPPPPSSSCRVSAAELAAYADALSRVAAGGPSYRGTIQRDLGQLVVGYERAASRAYVRIDTTDVSGAPAPRQGIDLRYLAQAARACSDRTCDVSQLSDELKPICVSAVIGMHMTLQCIVMPMRV